METRRSLVKPRYQDLTPEQRAVLCNGVGPEWFPTWLVKVITASSSLFFNEASWCHHDFGYSIGHTEADRLHCDRKFLEAMKRDAVLSGTLAIVALPLAYMFYCSVRLFGKYAFRYADSYLSQEDLDRMLAIRLGSVRQL